VLESFSNLERGIFGSFMKEIFLSVWLIKCSMNLDRKRKRKAQENLSCREMMKVW